MIDPTFSIVVPTFRRPHVLRETLGALLALDYPAGSYEVIVVDDGADDATAITVEQLGRRDIPVRVEPQHQRGAASARNRGARVANGELLLFCDDDMLGPPALLQRHLACHRRHPVAAVGSTFELAPELMAALQTTPFGRYRISLEERFLKEARGAPLEDDPSCLRMALLSAASLSIPKELFWSIGGFDEDFPLAGAEDQDLSMRARDAGMLLLLDTRIRCIHNDHNLTLRAYCEREERSAGTVAILVRKHAAALENRPYARENRPIDACDPPALVAKKLMKGALANRLALHILHRFTLACEAVGAPEPLLRRLYTGLLGLHLFRGFRGAWRH
jgi:glycosyltransferase involved in cell wall biosynthesis